MYEISLDLHEFNQISYEKRLTIPIIFNCWLSVLS